jgi:hypothetical protein
MLHEAARLAEQQQVRNTRWCHLRDHLRAFEAQLRDLLASASADGKFSEQMQEIALNIWR